MGDPAARTGKSRSSARLFAHGGIYGLEHVLQTLVMLILLPVYARYLGTSGYGKIGVLLAFSGVLNILMLQGLGSAWFRLRILPEVRNRVGEFQTTLVVYLAISVGAIALLFFLLGPRVSPLLTPNIPFYPWWPWVLIIAASAVFATLYRNAARSDQKPVQYMIFTALQQLATVAAILFMVVYLEAGALGQLQGTAMAAVPFAVLGLFLLRPYRRSPDPRGDLKLSFAYGLPVLPHMLAAPLNTLIDRSVVNVLLGTSLTGVYVAGQQISRLGDAVAQALNRAYAPIFNALAQEAEEAGLHTGPAREKLHDIAEMGYALTLAILAIGTGLVALSREVLLFLANPEFASAWRIILLLVAAEIMRTYYHVFGRPIQFKLEAIRFMPILSWSSIGVNLAGNFILIPFFGIVGAALATFFSQAGLAVATLVLGHRTMAIPYRWGSMAAAFAGFLLTAAALTACDARFESLTLRLPLKIAVALPFLLYATVSLYRHLQMPGFAALFRRRRASSSEPAE